MQRPMHSQLEHLRSYRRAQYLRWYLDYSALFAKLRYQHQQPHQLAHTNYQCIQRLAHVQMMWLSLVETYQWANFCHSYESNPRIKPLWMHMYLAIYPVYYRNRTKIRRMLCGALTNPKSQWSSLTSVLCCPAIYRLIYQLNVINRLNGMGNYKIFPQWSVNGNLNKQLKRASPPKIVTLQSKQTNKISSALQNIFTSIHLVSDVNK